MRPAVALAETRAARAASASGPEKVFLITDDYVRQMVASVVKDQDLSRYIL